MVFRPSFELHDNTRYSESLGVSRYIAGHDYFYALSELLDKAKETIQILDWYVFKFCSYAYISRY